MKTYYRVLLGKGHVFAQQAHAENFIGVDYDVPEDLSTWLPDEWRLSNPLCIPVYLERHPERSKVAAGLACGALWIIAKGILIGDMVLSPDGTGSYRVGEVTGDYQFTPGQALPHRRPVQWSSHAIHQTEMSEQLRGSFHSSGTVIDITRHHEEIERLQKRDNLPTIISTDPSIEDPAAFALEKHLEDFLVQNWAQTELGKDYDLFEVDGERVGQQYQTAIGPIDILAIRKDKKELLVLELKKGKASDAVVGQVLRYMGFVSQELAEEDQSVKGVIIALEDDSRIRYALAATSNIVFYRYQIRFKLIKPSDLQSRLDRGENTLSQ